ncbi:MAG: hypothetical protein M1125_04460 [Candidatus Marsarchaeota archaeon]|nr:hypothetical protein [Candidatus Marsarchaeota archaeon]
MAEKKQIFAEAASQQGKHTLPFILMLISGIFIIGGALLYSVALRPVSANAIIANLTTNSSVKLNATQIGVIRSEINSGVYTDTVYGLIGFGVLCGVLLLISSYMVYRPKSRSSMKTFSIIAIIFALLSIFANAGLIIGLVLGVIGGILGLMNK